jgi:hypothetical protein
MTANAQLPARIQAKLASINDKATLRVIGDNRLARRHARKQGWSFDSRRQTIFLACIERRQDIFKARCAAHIANR